MHPDWAGGTGRVILKLLGPLGSARAAQVPQELWDPVEVPRKVATCLHGAVLRQSSHVDWPLSGGSRAALAGVAGWVTVRGRGMSQGH